jgi:hypothetical protein
MLSPSVFRQRFEPVARRNAKVIERPGIIDESQLAKRHGLNVRR